jgi:hypothetical protein
MKVEIAIAKGESVGHHPCWITIGDHTYCIVDWVGDPVKKAKEREAEEFSPHNFHIINLMEMLKVKE